MSVAERIATPEGKRQYVRSLFETIADRYDFITVALSYGLDRRWKRWLVRLAWPARGRRALDLATGTGDIAFALSKHGTHVVGLDVTKHMIELARAKVAKGSEAPTFVVGDMLELPFPAESFDLVTIGYGLRNVPDLATALDEVLRVLRPGGYVLSLDFNRPENRLVRAAYLKYLAVVGGLLGWVLHGDPDTYRYIAASIRTFPGGPAVAELMRTRGFPLVHCYFVLGGLMVVHHARKRL